MHYIKRTISTNRTFETIYVRSTLCQKLFSEINRFKPILITLCKKKKKISGKTKQDMIEYLKAHSKGSDICHLSCSTIPNLLCRPTMVIEILEDFEPPSKKFLATPLLNQFPNAKSLTHSLSVH